MKNQINVEDVIQTSEKVLTMIKDKRVIVRQVNGQIIVNSPPLNWKGPPPHPGCEIFVGKIPRNIYEDKIYEIFAEIGQIYELRLMMDFSGNTRGYCFIHYSTAEEANRAIKTLNNFEIAPGRRIGVVRSINNCRLCIAQLPPDIPSIAIIRKIFSITQEVENVAVYRSHRGRARYSIISYKSHRGAAMARRRLVPERATLFGDSPVTVDWAHPDMQPYGVIEDIGFTDINGEVQIRRSTISWEGNRTFSSISRNRKEALDRNIKYYVQEDMSLPSKQICKIISAPDRSNHSSSQTNSQLFPRILDSAKPQLSQSFNLFDDFTFSISNPRQEDPGSVGSLEHLLTENHNENWMDEITPQLSNMSLQPEEGRTLMADPSKIVGHKEGLYSSLLQDKGFPGPRGNVGPFNSMKGFPFHQLMTPTILPNGIPYVCTQIPGCCMIPPQSPFVDSWPIDNRPFYGYNQHHCMPTTCAVCYEEFTHSNAHRMPEACNLNCCNQHMRLNEAQPSEYEEIQGKLEPPEQEQAAFKGRKQKPRGVFEKPKPVRKIPAMKVNSRRNHSANRDFVEEENLVCKTAQLESIPKGARPILSAKK